MKGMPKHVFSFAANHFGASFILGVICFVQFYGAGLSDVYHPEPFWIKIILALLWVLQLPVVIFETVALRHSKQGANVLLLCVLGLLWSICLDYIVPWLLQIARNKNRR